jgi:hypothetical protein
VEARFLLRFALIVMGGSMKAKKGEKGEKGVPRRTDSHTQLKGVRTVAAILPPSPLELERSFDPERSALGRWADATLRLTTALDEADQALSDSDVHAHRVIDVLVVVADALYDSYLDASDPRMQPFVVADSPLDEFSREVFAIANETIGRLTDPEGRHELSMFWMLGERLALLPRLDARPWLAAIKIDATDLIEPLRNLGPNALMLNSAVAALVQALRLIASPSGRSSPPIRPLGLEEWLEGQGNSRETNAPPSRQRIPVAAPIEPRAERRSTAPVRRGKRPQS